MTAWAVRSMLSGRNGPAVTGMRPDHAWSQADGSLIVLAGYSGLNRLRHSPNGRSKVTTTCRSFAPRATCRIRSYPVDVVIWYALSRPRQARHSAKKSR